MTNVDDHYSILCTTSAIVDVNKDVRSEDGTRHDECSLLGYDDAMWSWRHQIPNVCILHCYRRENIKAYITLTGWAL
jgi:hypothetical protein